MTANPYQKYAPFFLLPIYVLAISLLFRGAIFLAFGAYLISLVLIAHTLKLEVTPGDKRKRWLLFIVPFWVVLYPTCVLRYGLKKDHLGLAFIQGIGGLSVGVLLATAVQYSLPLQNGALPKDISSMHFETPPIDQAAKKNAVLEILNGHPFQAPWWLRNQHMQTVWNPFFRKQSPIAYASERVDTPDGDFIYLHFYPGEEDKPLVLLLHGLEGSVKSPYMTGLGHTFHSMGWNSVAMEFRFCSGEINKTKRIYHMGETGDVDFIARLLCERFPGKAIYVMGVSLGANVVGKWLGEQGDNYPKGIAGAALVSPPFNPTISAPDFHKILFGVYVQNFLKTLLPKARAKEKQFPGCLDLEKLNNCNDFYTYDTEVTARLHGFVDAYDYWEKVGCHQFVGRIRVPTLLLTSEDDPFNPPETIPRAIADESPWLHPQWTSQGGHVGFIAGPAPLFATSWFEGQVARFFAAYDKIESAK